MPVATIVAGARYVVCGERMRADAWEVDGGAETWIILEDAATDAPRYLVKAGGAFERIERLPDGTLHSVPCDVTAADVTLAVMPL